MAALSTIMTSQLEDLQAQSTHEISKGQTLWRNCTKCLHWRKQHLSFWTKAMIKKYKLPSLCMHILANVTAVNCYSRLYVEYCNCVANSDFSTVVTKCKCILQTTSLLMISEWLVYMVQVCASVFCSFSCGVPRDPNSFSPLTWPRLTCHATGLYFT
jgi:hypothetical protein